jgi:hypothetical protein
MEGCNRAIIIIEERAQGKPPRKREQRGKNSTGSFSCKKCSLKKHHRP